MYVQELLRYVAQVVVAYGIAVVVGFVRCIVQDSVVWVGDVVVNGDLSAKAAMTSYNLRIWKDGERE